MTIYLPKPYPDELLYSNVARYITYSGMRQIYTLQINLLGARSRLSPFLPRGLSTVSHQTWAVWHMSGVEIARRLTMYPYYGAFIPSSQKEQLMDYLLTSTPSEFARYLVSRRLPHTLRYCQKCRRADVAKYGETYWRRAHQMKGVHVCPDHGDELIGVPFTHNTTWGDLINPTEATRTGQMPILNLDQYDKKQLLAIARRCRSILENKIEPQWQNANPSLYRAIAMEKGMCNQRKGCQLRIIVQKFSEMYSDRVIRTLEFREGEDIEAWVAKIFSGTEKHSFQPVDHAVIQEFLSEVPGDSDRSMLFGPGPWKCPNPLAQHESSFPIRRVNVERDKYRNVFARTTCCCGYGFEFYATDPTDRSMPVVHHVTEYGPTWEGEIRQLNGAGMSASKIASALNVPATEVIRILKGSSVTSLRRQWLDALNATESHMLVETRRLNPRLYEMIKKSDPNYLSCNSPRTRHHSPKQESWMQKDRVLSARLRPAAELILNEIPPTRASVRAILRRSGISRWIVRSEFKECRRVLREICETSEAFQKRRLKYQAEQAKAQGIKLERNQLYRKAHIADKYQKRLETYVDSLCE